MHRRRFTSIALFVASLLLSPAPTRAAEAAAEKPYSGSFLERSTLTGDWNNGRNTLADKGVTVDATLTQIGQGVVDGGKSHEWEYGGRVNLTEKFDTEKMGLWPGGFVSLQLDGNWSDSVNPNTGALMPANSAQLYPWPGNDNLNVSELSFTQFLSPHFGAMVGKLETVSLGDSNEFAHGRGDTQFLNLAFNINPVLIFSAPYSTLGAAAVVLPVAGDPDSAIVNFAVLQTNGSSQDVGFDDLDEDQLTFLAQGRMRTNFFGLTGHQLVGGLYSNKKFTSLDQRLDEVLDNQQLKPKDGTWAVFYNFDQYLYERDKQAGQGLGVFGRFGASDGNPNLMQYFVSIGFGGTGMLPGRPYDRFGIGYYFVDVSKPTFQGALTARSFLQDEHGFEVFYNFAITPWVLLTPDLQVIRGAQKERAVSGKNVDAATVLGFRLQLIL